MAKKRKKRKAPRRHRLLRVLIIAALLIIAGAVISACMMAGECSGEALRAGFTSGVRFYVRAVIVALALLLWGVATSLAYARFHDAVSRRESPLATLLLAVVALCLSYAWFVGAVEELSSYRNVWTQERVFHADEHCAAISAEQDVTPVHNVPLLVTQVTGKVSCPECCNRLFLYRWRLGTLAAFLLALVILCSVTDSHIDDDI